MSVAALRQRYAASTGTERFRAGLRLGLVLAADPERATEAATLLAPEVGTGAHRAGITAEVARARYTVARGRVPAPDAGPAPSVGAGMDTRALRDAAARAREMLPTLAPTDPRYGHLQMLSEMDGLLGLAAAGRWRPQDAKALTRIRSVREAPTTSPDAAAGAAAMEVLLRGAELIQQPGRPVDPVERDALIADAATAIDHLERAVPQAGPAAGSLHAMIGILLIQRANAALPDDRSRLEDLARAREHIALAPPELATEAASLVSMVDGVEDGFEHVLADGGGLAQQHQELWFSSGGAIMAAVGLAERARRTRAPEDFAAAVDALRSGRRSLPAGHPAHADVLAVLANLLGHRASLTQSPEDLAEAMDAGIEAIRATDGPPTLEICAHLAGIAVVSLLLDQRTAPAGPAHQALAGALAAAPAGGMLRASLLVGLAAARALLWRMTRDDAGHREMRAALDEAATLLADLSRDRQWFGSAMCLLQTNVVLASVFGDRTAAAPGLRAIELVETAARDRPELAAAVAAEVVLGGPSNSGWPLVPTGFSPASVGCAGRSTCWPAPGSGRG